MQPQPWDDSLVSVITPVYNAQKFIEKTIACVQAQTYPNWELILADDCSTDESPALIARYAAADPRIRYIRLETNSGAARARNRALEQAQGRFVAFLDADDLWKMDKLERQLAFMREKGAAFSYTGIDMIGEDGAVVKPKRRVRPVVGYGYLLTNTVIACSSVVIDRGAAGDFRMADVRKGQDYATWLSLLRGGLVAHGLDEALVEYRLVKGSVSSNKIRALQRTWRIYRDFEHLSVPRAAVCFGLYAFHAGVKYFF